MNSFDLFGVPNSVVLSSNFKRHVQKQLRSIANGIYQDVEFLRSSGDVLQELFIINDLLFELKCQVNQYSSSHAKE